MAECTSLLFIFNVFDIIVLQIAINGAIADFVTILSALLVARFLLRLREVGTDDLGSSLQLSTIEIRHSQSGLDFTVDSLGRALGQADFDMDVEEF
ncbi:hypothetical protein BN946_scf184844.g104 [Trametes cinnabarina]|uniref:Uncharacterized protein n=1 Tax=Pycnoporus cinnabarinus TaxID=5643 RepID=A0A060S9S5_PYCCI|nr:hypothetical protein BN946_scf184844.g104 [Trametes cinnabarina]